MLGLLGLALFLIGTVLFLSAALIWYLMAKWEYDDNFNVMCPETLQLCEVRVDGRRAARTRFAGHEELRLTACSRWPEKRNCNQACAAEVPFLGDGRSKTKYAPFGLQPSQLRIMRPVQMTKELYDRVMPSKVS